MIREALYFHTNQDKVNCDLCPHNCVIKEGKSGICITRKVVNGSLITQNYGLLSAINFDPVEKKPLYHFYPGKLILSIGSLGCNMRCDCCQNWQISQAVEQRFISGDFYSAQEIVNLAGTRSDNIGIAYTYNEPTVWFEFMLDTARIAFEKGLKNVMVSNGYINEKPLEELLDVIDAYNIDLKSYSNDFYKKVTGAKLHPVLESIKTIVKHNKHVEVTNLVIPGLNNAIATFKEMIDWIVDNTGEDTVLHLSRYHPMFKMNIESTPSGMLDELYGYASEKLSYVYVGNINLKDYHDTKCKSCDKVVIRRIGYRTDVGGIDERGNCRYCGTGIVIC